MRGLKLVGLSMGFRIGVWEFVPPCNASREDQTSVRTGAHILNLCTEKVPI